jgi:hypothetical protein
MGKNVAPENVCVPGPDAPLAYHRPGYSSSGCTPAEPDFASPGNDHFSLAKDGTQRTGNGWEVTRSESKRLAVKIESGTQVASRGTDMAQCDAAGVNGSNRILFHGALLLRMMPNGCLGSPVLVLLFGLDRGFLMDVGPERAGHFGLRAESMKPKRAVRRCGRANSWVRFFPSTDSLIRRPLLDAH